MQYIIWEVIFLNFTKADIEQYLSDVFAAIHVGQYQIAPREKNQNMYIEVK